MKITNITAQMQSVRDDLFDQELDDMEASQRAPRGRRREFLTSFDDQDETDAQVAQDLKDMQKEYFGKPGGMGTGKHKTPWSKNQLDPYRNREPTKDELDEIERNLAQETELGVTEQELNGILDQEYGLDMPDDFTDEDAVAVDLEPEIDWEFRHKLVPKKTVAPESDQTTSPWPNTHKKRNY